MNFDFDNIKFQYFFEFNKADVDRDMFLRNQRLVTVKKKQKFFTTKISMTENGILLEWFRR